MLARMVLELDQGQPVEGDLLVITHINHLVISKVTDPFTKLVVDLLVNKDQQVKDHNILNILANTLVKLHLVKAHSNQIDLNNIDHKVKTNLKLLTDHSTNLKDLQSNDQPQLKRPRPPHLTPPLLLKNQPQPL